jgi:hypothetical protein
MNGDPKEPADEERTKSGEAERAKSDAGPHERAAADHDEPPPESGHDSAAMRAFLKRSLATPEPANAPRPDVLRGVQRKLRQRSKGKFYADGWSTTQSKVSYALVAIIMLVLVAVVYFVLGPTGITR